MNYEKKYKEIVGKIRKAYLYAQTDSTKAVLKEIIPELAESEDEKVRKEIVNYFQCQSEEEPTRKEIHNKWLAWLEKQGQVKESTISQHENKTCEENGNSLTCEDEKVRKTLIDFFGRGAKYGGQTNGVYDKDIIAWLERQGEHANFRNKIQVGDKVTRNEDGVLVNLSQLDRVAKKNEKQCKQKFEMKTAEESLGIDSDTYNKIVDECIFGEQKPADKVEPKFKVGEKELTNEELCEGLIRGMVNEHNRVTKEVLRNEYEKGRADVLAKIDAIDVDEMVYESGATSRVTQYWYAHGVNDVIKKLKEGKV